MKKGLEIIMKNNPNASAKEIQEFIDTLEDNQINFETVDDIDALFSVYSQDNTSDKWLFWGLFHFEPRLSSHEMIIITETLKSYRLTVDNLIKYNVNIIDTLYFMHCVYSVYNDTLSPDKKDTLVWEKFIHVIVGGNALADIIKYSSNKVNNYDFKDNDDIEEYYRGLLEVMKLDNYDKVKLYIDFTLS